MLLEANESTTLLIKARRLLMQTAIQELRVSADDLPKYKPPPPAVAVAGSSSSSSSQQATSTFNPYQRHRYNATGQPQQPDSYESTTETRLKQLQKKQEKLEAQFSSIDDRELVAFRPNQQAPPLSASTTTTTSSSTNGPSDGTLLAQRMKRLEQERKEREEGGFTTKAMRELQKMQNTKVYSHCKLRIQFPDGSALEGKFLPRETVEIVKQTVSECFTVNGLDFDLYVAPPRRQLDISQTLQQEGLVPAAKVFVSWKSSPSNDVFLKQELFSSDTSAAPAFPTAKPVVQQQAAKKKDDSGDDKKKAATSTKSSREDDLLRRMMGGSKGGSSKAKRASDGKSGGKPKWFKG